MNFDEIRKFDEDLHDKLIAGDTVKDEISTIEKYITELQTFVEENEPNIESNHVTKLFRKWKTWLFHRHSVLYKSDLEIVYKSIKVRNNPYFKQWHEGTGIVDPIEWVANDPLTNFEDDA
ncbi:MAG: hypothetical protein COB29_10985 [Sulfitobacter sp.]|nr:MAG: hypothetical protein COB29_10985 [Sulfitobacter sp.]